MPNLPNLQECTGCGACAQLCPKGAIHLTEDAERFIIPQIDASECIECGLCAKRCPQINSISENYKPVQRAYALISKDDRNVSSSGGAFSVFARYVLKYEGVVFGAAFYQQNEEGDYIRCFPKLRHVWIEKVNDLDLLRGSKYLQSEIGQSYKACKKFLNMGKMVLFTGTPCQIAGLYQYLGQRHEGRLLTLDLVCHGVPSYALFASYLTKLNKAFNIDSSSVNTIIDFRFRNLSSWDYRTAAKISETKTWKRLEQEKNIYMKAFFRKLIFRESCYECHYSNMNRVGTFTIADYWGIGKHGYKFSKNISSGVSLVIDNRGIMPDIFTELGKFAYIEERPLEEGRIDNYNLNSPSVRPTERDTAVCDMLDKNINVMDYAVKYKMLDNRIQHLLKNTFKNILYKTGLYNAYKSLSYKCK